MTIYQVSCIYRDREGLVLSSTEKYFLKQEDAENAFRKLDERSDDSMLDFVLEALNYTANTGLTLIHVEE
jgi:hypothetical protein